MIFLYFLVINLPLIILTFDNHSFSDDFQICTLLSVQSKFIPIWSLIWDSVGGEYPYGHFAPIYILGSYLFSFFTIDPRIFHLQVILIYSATAYILYLIVYEYFNDRKLAILSGTLFALNYYISFKSNTWNCFHSHTVNTFTGAVSLYFLLRFLKANRFGYLIGCGILYLLTIYNLESGFVFTIVLLIVIFDEWLRQRITKLKAFLLGCFIIFITLAYPVGAYLSLGTFNPMGHRLGWTRDVQGYLYNASDLFVKSTGLAFLYNNIIFNPLKDNPAVKEPFIKVIRQHDLSAIKEIPLKFINTFIIIWLTFFLSICLATRIIIEERLFLSIYLAVFIAFFFTFYRTDIANALGLFSSVLLAKLLVSLFKDKNTVFLGWTYVVLLAIATIGTISDRFDDCYQKSFFGIKKVVIDGPHKIYDQINAELGHYSHGLILFTHDYTQYHRTNREMRIGDMINVPDFIAYNSTVYREEFLKSDFIYRYQDKSLTWLGSSFGPPRYQKIIINSKVEALEYINSHQSEVRGKDIIYMSPDYRIEKL